MTVDTSREIRLVLSPLRTIFVGVTSLLLAITCLGIALGILPDLTTRQQFYGWLGAAFFLLGAYAVFSQGLGKDRPTLTLSPDGFHFTSVSARMVPWAAVMAVQKWAHGKTPLVIVQVDEDVWSEAGMTEDAVKARITNKMRGVDGIAIAATGLPIKFADLLAAFQAYAKAHGGMGRR